MQQNNGGWNDLSVEEETDAKVKLPESARIDTLKHGCQPVKQAIIQFHKEEKNDYSKAQLHNFLSHNSQWQPPKNKCERFHHAAERMQIVF